MYIVTAGVTATTGLTAAAYTALIAFVAFFAFYSVAWGATGAGFLTTAARAFTTIIYAAPTANLTDNTIAVRIVAAITITA